jgi:hypothetical protein
MTRRPASPRSRSCIEIANDGGPGSLLTERSNAGFQLGSDHEGQEVLCLNIESAGVRRGSRLRKCAIFGRLFDLNSLRHPFARCKTQGSVRFESSPSRNRLALSTSARACVGSLWSTAPVNKIEVGREPSQQLDELVRRDRCRVLHLSLESTRAASGQALYCAYAVDPPGICTLCAYLLLREKIIKPLLAGIPGPEAKTPFGPTLRRTAPRTSSNLSNHRPHRHPTFQLSPLITPPPMIAPATIRWDF